MIGNERSLYLDALARRKISHRTYFEIVRSNFQVSERGLATIICSLPDDDSRIPVKQPDHCLAIQMTLGRTAHGQQKNGSVSVVGGDAGSIGIGIAEAPADYLGRRTGREQQAQS